MRAILCFILMTFAAMSRVNGGNLMETTVGPVADKRYDVVRTLDLKYDVSHLSSRFKRPEDWKRRAAHLREQILASAGLLPMPEKTPLNPVVFGKIDRGDYTVEKVRFESLPGFFVTGNLYRPKGHEPFPAVLNPHGHWKNGRLEDSSDCSVPGRCISFARQGYAAFSYDMIGFGDSALQMNHDLSGRREKLWNISLGGLQLWNSIRALDFLESLPEVDRSRIGCTGASGGGTQTFLLSAVDDRVKVSAPVNMISAHMQGGCQCENLPGLRVDTNNVEIAALMAPRPMLMVSATGDWTDETPKVEFPAVRHVYELLGAADRVDCVQMDAGHNYNKASREAVYSWFAQWLLARSLKQPVREKPFEVEKKEDLLVFPDGRLPADALYRDGLIKLLIDRSERQLEAHKPADSRSLRTFRRRYLPALQRALSLCLPIDAEADVRGEEKADGRTITRLVIRGRAGGAEVPALLLSPQGQRKAAVVLMIHEKGKQALLNETGDGPGSVVRELLEQGRQVLLIDCFGTGEHIRPVLAPARDPSLAFFDTYNRTDTAERIYDILLALDYLQRVRCVKEIHLAGFGKAGLWCLLARPFANKVKRTVVDACRLDTTDDQPLLGNLYVPGLRWVGDFRTAQALSAPGSLFIHNTQGRFDTSWGAAAYAAAGRTEALRVTETLAADIEIVRWIVGT